MDSLFSAPIASGKPTVFPILPPRRTPVLRPSSANSAKKKLFLRFLMDSLFPAPFAILFYFDFALYQLFILAAPVVDAFAFRTSESNEKIL